MQARPPSAAGPAAPAAPPAKKARWWEKEEKQEILKAIDTGGVRAADNTLIVEREVDDFEAFNLFKDPEPVDVPEPARRRRSVKITHKGVVVGLKAGPDFKANSGTIRSLHGLSEKEFSIASLHGQYGLGITDLATLFRIGDHVTFVFGPDHNPIKGMPPAQPAAPTAAADKNNVFAPTQGMHATPAAAAPSRRASADEDRGCDDLPGQFAIPDLDGDGRQLLHFKQASSASGRIGSASQANADDFRIKAGSVSTHSRLTLRAHSACPQPAGKLSQTACCAHVHTLGL
ncbi:hypothetical protein WJX72_010295 [[Myrmecia] bisecta]|uniref:Uncharacterized protein n=1 Tax=[Myrmecia] bisecta TaxID=41462 RepID=A0AAW1PDY2_9CHLO